MSNKLKASFIFIAVFLAGAIAGSALSLGIVKRFVVQKTGEQVMYKRLLDRLDLTAEQNKKAEEIYVPFIKRMAENRRENLVEQQRCDQAIRALLNSEQLRKFDEHRAAQRDRDQRWQRHVREERKRFDDARKAAGTPPLPAPPPPSPEPAKPATP